MAYEADKTEHAGPKKGRGAFWGHKCDAKAGSDKRRRFLDRVAVREQLPESDEPRDASATRLTPGNMEED